MDLSIIDQLLKLLEIPFSSILMIEISIIFLLLYIFLVYNEKRESKKVKVFLSAIIIFFISALIFYFSDDVEFVLTEIIKTIMNCFYFPNIIFYFSTVIISLIMIIYTMLSSKLTKFNKIITYTFTLLHLFLFTNFITYAIINKTNLTNTANIYQNDNMYIIVFFSQILFFIIIIYKAIYHFCYIRKEKLKNINESDIMFRK